MTRQPAMRDSDVIPTIDARRRKLTRQEAAAHKLDGWAARASDLPRVRLRSEQPSEDPSDLATS